MLAFGAALGSFRITLSPATVLAALPFITPAPPAPFAVIVCVARLFPAAVRSLPPLAVAPPPPLENRPRLSLVYLLAITGARLLSLPPTPWFLRLQLLQPPLHHQLQHFLLRSPIGRGDPLAEAPHPAANWFAALAHQNADVTVALAIPKLSLLLNALVHLVGSASVARVGRTLPAPIT